MQVLKLLNVLLLKCVVAAQLILDVCIVGIQLRSSEQQIVCSFVSSNQRTLGSSVNTNISKIFVYNIIMKQLIRFYE